MLPELERPLELTRHRSRWPRAGMTHATPCNMTLPYPLEVETGSLAPRPRFERVALDVERLMREAIRSNAEGIELFGVQFPHPQVKDGDLVERLRRELTTHFNRRVATPDVTTWQEFRDRARAQLESHARLDRGVLPMLRATIDGL